MRKLLSRHGRNHRPGGSDPIDFPALRWATAPQSGPADVADSDPSARIGFDEGTLTTNDSSLFTLDDDGSGRFGVGIQEPGHYFAWFTVQVADTPGDPVASPETTVVHCDDGVASEVVTGTLLGSNYSRGYADEAGGSKWDVSWGRDFDIDTDTGGAPITLSVYHETGATLKAYGDVFIFKLEGTSSFETVTTASVGGGGSPSGSAGGDLAGTYPNPTLAPGSNGFWKTVAGVLTRVTSVAWSELTGIPSTFAPSAHKTSHETGGSDALTADLDANARVGVRKNSTGSTSKRRRLNFIEGSNVTLTVADDGTDEEVDVTIASSGGGGGSVASDTIWDAKGDLAVASAADTAARLPVGSNDQVLVADSGQTLGVKWAAVPGTSAFVPESLADAKGDLIVASANDTFAKLGVGSDSQVLTADSAQTLGVKWAAVPSSGGVKLYDYEVTGSDKASIDTNVDGTTVANFSGYDVLEVWIIARTDDAGANASVNINVNNDTGAKYDNELLNANNATVSAGPALADTKWSLLCHGSGGSASYPTIFRVSLPGYARTVFNKVGELTLAETDATAGNNFMRATAIGFRDTSAITRLKVAAVGSAKLKVGSRLMVYGR